MRIGLWGCPHVDGPDAGGWRESGLEPVPDIQEVAALHGCNELPPQDPGVPLFWDDLPPSLPDWLGRETLYVREDRDHPALAKALQAVAGGSIGRAGACRIRVREASEAAYWLARAFGGVTKATVRQTQGPSGVYTLATVSFGSGVVAHVEIDPASPGLAFEVCGSEGMLEFDFRTGTALFQRGNPVPGSPPSDLRRFADSLRSGKPLRSSFDTIRTAVELLRVLRNG